MTLQQGHAVKFALFFVKSKHLCLAQKLSNQNILLTFKWKVENSTVFILFNPSFINNFSNNWNYSINVSQPKKTAPNYPDSCGNQNKSTIRGSEAWAHSLSIK